MPGQGAIMAAAARGCVQVLSVKGRVMRSILAAGGLAVAAVAFTADDAHGEVSGPHPLDDEARAILAVPEHVVATGNDAPLIRYSRRLSGGAHTHGAWNGGWQVSHALAVWAGDASAEDRMLEQIRHSLDGENSISANGGYPAQHERNITGAYAILRHTPHFWQERLTPDDRHKIDLLMKASLVASAYTTADATYDGDMPHSAIDGNTNLHRGWNPNFREGMFGALIVASVHFGGHEAAQDILDNYDHDAFVTELEAAGLSNTHETFTWAANHPDSGAPSGERIERHVRGYRFQGEALMSPMDLLHYLTMHTYGAEVACGLNDGEGIMHDGVPTGVIVSGCEGLPNKGRTGMLLEFASRDASGPRSSMVYAYDGFRPNLTNHVVTLVGGFWEPGAKADEIIERKTIGVTDLVYKLEHGYRNYAHGRGSHDVYDINREHWSWSYRTTIPLWTEVVRPFHER